MSAFLAALVTDLARYAEVGKPLAEQASFLWSMGDDEQLLAFNAQDRGQPAWRKGAALDAVARLLTEQSRATSPLVATVAERAARVRDIEDMEFQVSLSTIQSEMVAMFAHEVCDHPQVQTGAARNMLALADALKRGQSTGRSLPLASTHSSLPRSASTSAASVSASTGSR